MFAMENAPVLSTAAVALNPAARRTWPDWLPAGCGTAWISTVVGDPLAVMSAPKLSFTVPVRVCALLPIEARLAIMNTKDFEFIFQVLIIGKAGQLWWESSSTKGLERARHASW